MVVDQSRRSTYDEPKTEPNCLSLHKKINVTMTVAGESTRAKEHDDANDQHAQNGQEQKIGTLAMHLSIYSRGGGGGTGGQKQCQSTLAVASVPLFARFFITPLSLVSYL